LLQSLKISHFLVDSLDLGVELGDLVDEVGVALGAGVKGGGKDLRAESAGAACREEGRYTINIDV
jgi:hypothetical protein